MYRGLLPRREGPGDEAKSVANSSHCCTMMPHASTTIDTLDKVSMAQLRLRLVPETLQYSTSFSAQSFFIEIMNTNYSFLKKCRSTA